MNVTVASGVRRLRATILIAWTLVYPTVAKLLDPDADAYHPLLQGIASDLDRDGIDVVVGQNSDVQTRGLPVVSPLANYPSRGARNEDKWADTFVDSFMAGATGRIMALKTNDLLDEKTFAHKWQTTRQEQRIFISFARDDLELARKIKAVIEAHGHVAFIYLDADGKAAQSPAEVGTYFRTAGTHLLIDTATARKSNGVLAEALALNKYQEPATSGRYNKITQHFRVQKREGSKVAEILKSRVEEREGRADRER